MIAANFSQICRRRAMNTFFEIVVYGEDLENRIAAAEAALDEVQRVETVLSRFDPASEVSRVNREAHLQPVRISLELLKVLQQCRYYWTMTSGHFDITATSECIGDKPGFQNLIIDEKQRTVHFTQKGLRLDFGGFGKGYALDCGAEILRENGLNNALLHGGTSSVLTLGHSLDGEAWRVGVRHPDDEKIEIAQLSLSNQGLSSSAVFGKDQEPSDILNLVDLKPVFAQASAVVVCATAAEAEIFSTAFLSMGENLTAFFLQKNINTSRRTLWIEVLKKNAQLRWLA